MRCGTTGASEVYFNGRIYTVDAEFSVAEAMVVKEDRLIYVGTNDVAEKFIDNATKVIDLKGKTVIPGLIEAHMHYGWFSQSLIEVNGLERKKEDILEDVRRRAECLPEGEWIRGRGWNHVNWGTGFPSKQELDEVAPNNPVCLIRTDCHSYWVNSKALEAAGIDASTADPDGGEIIREENGEPSGILVDTAGDILLEKIPPYSRNIQLKALLKAQEYLLSLGFTSIMDAGAEISELEAMEALCKSGDQKLRLYVYAKEGESAEHCYKKGIQIGMYDNRMTVRGVKLFCDGSTGSRGAALLEDYADRPGHKGIFRYTDEEMYNTVREARKNGFQLSVHVNGDASVEQVINAYIKVLDEMPLEDNRWRLEHYQLITKEQLAKTVEYGFIPSMQFVQCTSDRVMITERYGKDTGRLDRAYIWRDIVDAGLHIANGSDAPVELVNPYHGIYAAITRKGRDGQPEDGWYTNQCLSREEALRADTIWAAEAHFEENMKGSLESGKLADFTVLDRDIINCSPKDIIDTQVLMTVIGGEVVYEKK